MAIHIIFAFILAFILVKKKKLNENLPYEIFIAIIPLGIAFARLFAVILEPDLTITDYFKFRDGGMSILGAIVGGAIGIVILCLIRKHNFFEVTDLLCTVLIIAQAIGRWGNYFNSEVYGQVITNEKWQWFPFAVEINGTYFEALFFYESFLNLIGFVVLLILYLKVKQKGVVLGSYLTYYGIVRFFLEPRRQAEYIYQVGNVQFSRLLSGVMVLIGIGILTYVIVNYIKKKKEKVVRG